LITSILLPFYQNRLIKRYNITKIWVLTQLIGVKPASERVKSIVISCRNEAEHSKKPGLNEPGLNPTQSPTQIFLSIPLIDSRSTH
jgi:hypothetical protein